MLVGFERHGPNYDNDQEEHITYYNTKYTQLQKQNTQRTDNNSYYYYGYYKINCSLPYCNESIDPLMIIFYEY